VKRAFKTYGTSLNEQTLHSGIPKGEQKKLMALEAYSIT
jgi:hypothetical protein